MKFVHCVRYVPKSEYGAMTPMQIEEWIVEEFNALPNKRLVTNEVVTAGLLCDVLSPEGMKKRNIDPMSLWIRTTYIEEN